MIEDLKIEKAESSSSSSSKMISISTAKIDVEKFDGRNNFGLWQSEVKDGLYQQDLDITIEDKKLDDMSQRD